MYQFIAHYVDMNDDKEITIVVEIDLHPIPYEDFHGQSEDLVAWKMAIVKSLDNKPDNWLFHTLELISC